MIVIAAPASVVAAYVVLERTERTVDALSHILLLFTLAVVVAARYGGLRSGLFATLLGMLLTLSQSSASKPGDGLVGRGLFVVVGIAISLLGESWRRQSRHVALQAQAALQKQRELELEIAAARKREQWERERHHERERELLEQTSDLQSTEERFRLLVEGTQDYAIFLLDPHGYVVSWNPGAERLTGYAASTIIGQHFSLFYPPEAVENHGPGEELRRAAEQGRVEDEGWRIRQDGSRFWVNVVLTALRDEQGKLRGYSKITRDLTERKQAEENARRLIEEQAARRAVEDAERRVRQSGEQQRLMMEALPHMVWTMDSDRKVEYLNGRMFEFTGHTAEEMSARGMRKFIHPDDLPRLSATISGPLKRGEPYEIEYRMLHRDGEYRWVVSRAVPLKEDGVVLRWVGSTQDVHEHRLAESEARERERRYRALVEATPQVVWTTGGSSKNGLSHWLDITGQTAEAASAGGWLEAVHPDDRERVRRTWTQAYETRQVYESEYRVRTAAGTYRHYAARGVSLADPQAAEQEWIGTLTDITEKKIAEIELRESEKRFRQLADAMPQIVWAARPDGHVDYYNRQWYDRTGFEVGGTGDQSWLPILHADDRQRCLDIWYESVKTGRLLQLELRLNLPAANDYRWYLVRALAARDEQGQIVRWYGTCTDIHDQKRAEEQLRELNTTLEKRVEERTQALRVQEQRFRAIFHAQFQFIGIMSPEGILLEANRTALAAAGVAEESVIGKPFWDTIWWTHDPVQRDRLRAAVRQAAAGRQDRFEAYHLAGDGTRIWVDFSLTPYRDENGKVFLLIPEGRDITLRKLAEEALRDKSQVLETVLDSIGDAVLVSECSGKILLQNRAFKDLHEGHADPDRLEQMPQMYGVYLPGGRQLCPLEHLPMTRAIQGESTEEIELEVVSAKYPNGIPVSVIGRPLLGPDGNTGGVVVIRDLAARRRNEAALRESEERFRTAFDHAPIGMALVAPNGRWLRVNSALCALTGYSEREMLETDFQTITHPDDRDRDRSYTERMLAGAIPSCQFEKRYLHKNGHVVHILLSASLVRDGAGQPLYFIRQMKDITARKASENALRENEERYRSVVESLAEGIVLQDEEGTIIASNERASSILGLSPDQIAGRKSVDPRWEAVHDDGSPFPGDQHPAMVALRTGKPVFNTIMGVKKPSGELTWMTVNAVAICSSAKERPRAVVASFHDITAARQLNEQVRASLREKEVLLKEIHHRVKNNLQIISSLLDLQAEQTQDRQALEMFRESRGRVRSMALIHERLYRSEDLARVNFSEYIQHLTNDLYHNYKVSEDDIILDVCVDVPPLAIDMAIPCGLLINELISNALKHAFAHTTEGHLWVALERGLDNTNVLTVADDGCGFPSDIDFRNTNSFGMQLVNTLVEQLHGEIELNTARGTAFTVTFPDLR